MNSGRGNQFLGRACPPRPAVPVVEKQRKPLQRRSELARGDKPLTEKPARPGARSTLKPSKGKRSKGEPPEIQAWREAAFERVREHEDAPLLDEVTGRPIEGRPVVHHPLEAGDLFAAGVAHLVVDGHPLVLHPDNSMVLDKRTHDKHHASGPGRVPIPLSCIREETWALVHFLDDRAGNQSWHCRMEADYS